jgi:hypothetical protein
MSKSKKEAVKQTFFKIEDKGETIDIQVEGKAEDLMTLFREVFLQNEDLKMVVTFALMASDGDEDDDEGPDEEGKDLVTLVRGEQN